MGGALGYAIANALNGEPDNWTFVIQGKLDPRKSSMHSTFLALEVGR